MQIPGYRIIRKINQGGMSTVYLAVQLSVGREVALKVMSPVLNADPVFSERFQREANIVGQLSHPNIVSIYDIGCYKGLNYIAMDYLPGGTVHDKMRGGMAATEVLRVIREIAKALDVAHTKGYVHRDIKPENILFREDGTAVLTDFGVAKTVSAAAKVTNAGTVVGTPHYMSPEQSRGYPIDGRSDIYSLGVVFYEMLTGVVPYQAEEAVAIAIKHLTAPIPTLPGQYAVYQSLLDRLLAKSAGDRFQQGAEIVEVVTAVEEALAGYPTRQTPYTDPSGMSVVALFKALLVTSFAALRVQLTRVCKGVFTWRWTPNRGFFRHPHTRVTEVHTDPGAAEDQRDPIVSTRIRKAVHYEELPTRKLSLLTRIFVTLFATSIIWSALCVGLVRFDVPVDRYFSGGLHEAIYSTAAVVQGYTEGLAGTGRASPSPATAETATATEPGENTRATVGEGIRQTQEAQPEPGPLPKAKPESKPTPRYTLTIVPQPEDARVRIMNIREKYRDGIELESGRYHVEVSRPGFETLNRWVRLEDDLAVDYHLDPRYVHGDSLRDTLADGSAGPDMVVVRAGRFIMGQKGEAASSPEREVHIPYKLAVSRYEITFAAYEKFVRASDATLPDDNRWGRGNRPAINVSWHDAVDYTAWLSEQTGQTYRLPTEAEWEYLARAGSEAHNWWGDEPPSNQANCKRRCDSEYTGLIFSETAPVGSFSKSPFGLHDTAGNVAEWVLDCYRDHYIGAPDDGSALTVENCSSHPVRGGAANDSYSGVYSHVREEADADTKSDMIGFRVVREFDY